jgi:hypothetical protein
VNTFGITILSYNHPELTARTIESVLQFVSPKQVFLLHNGSRNEVVQTLEQSFPHLTHFVEEKNLGYSGGANRLLNEAFENFEQVLFLTNDCVLTQLQPPPDSPANRGLVAPLIMKRKTGRWDSLGGVLNVQTYHLKHRTSASDRLKSNEIFYIPGTAFWIHRESFRSLGNFDESFGTYWEDVDFSLRAQVLKIPLSTHEGTQIQHGIGKTCHKDSWYTLYLYQRNRILCAQKNKHLTLGIWISSLGWCARTFFRLAKTRARWKDFPLLAKLLRDLLRMPMLRISAIFS